MKKEFQKTFAIVHRCSARPVPLNRSESGIDGRPPTIVGGLARGRDQEQERIDHVQEELAVIQ